MLLCSVIDIKLIKLHDIVELKSNEGYDVAQILLFRFFYVIFIPLYIFGEGAMTRNGNFSLQSFSEID